MQQLKLSEGTAARRRIPLNLVDATTGDPATGLTVSTSEVKISKNGASEGNSAGSVVEVAGGLYYYEATAGELGTLGVLTARVVKTGVAPFCALVQVIAPDPYDSVRLGLTALPNAAAGANGGLPTGNASGQVAVGSYASGQAPLQPTTAGRTLDVSTTGEAGLDFDNLKAATGATTLTNITVPVVTAVTNGVTVTTNNDKTGYTASTVSDKTGYSLSAGGVQAIWDALTSALTTVGSIGKRLADDIDATISSRNSTTPPTVAAIADGVWDEALSGHATGGSAGAALTGAGSAGDPWTATLPGSYGAGTAGKIVGDNINAPIDSRATQTSVNTVAGYIDTEVGTLVSNVAAILAAVDTEVAAIKLKTDLIAGTTLVSGDVPTASANAAALLAATVESGATVLQGLRSLLSLVSDIDGAPGGPLHLKSFDGTKNRVTFAPDADGNRTVSARDLT